MEMAVSMVVVQQMRTIRSDFVEFATVGDGDGENVNDSKTERGRHREEKEERKKGEERKRRRGKGGEEMAQVSFDADSLTRPNATTTLPSVAPIPASIAAPSTVSTSSPRQHQQA